MTITKDDIKNNYENLYAAITSNPGGISFNESLLETYSLYDKKIDFKKFDYESLYEALIGTSKTSAPSNQIQIVTEDLLETWAWCSQLVLASHCFTNKYSHLRELLCLITHLLLADTDSPTDLINSNPHAYWSIAIGNSAFHYLALPFLEGTLKTYLHQHLTIDGITLTPFLSKAGQKQYNKGNQCSSLKDLLWLAYQEQSSPELSSAIDRFGQQIDLIDSSTKDFYSKIYDWRNGSLHGQTNTLANSIVIFNLALTVALTLIKNDFENI